MCLCYEYRTGKEMKKRMLSWFLCACLLLPCCGVTVGRVAAAEADEYIIQTFSVRFAENIVLGNSNSVVATKGEKVSPKDLTQYGYDVDPSRVALQVDIYAPTRRRQRSEYCPKILVHGQTYAVSPFVSVFDGGTPPHG